MPAMIKRLLLYLCCLTLVFSALVMPAAAEAVEIKAKSVILIEQSTGQVLVDYNPDEKRAPASITKVMTLLLVMEAIESGQMKVTDKIAASPHACSMGGSQIWLEPGEEMTVDDLLKAVFVASANDAAVALGEALGGTEDGFVDLMNKRAGELGMTNTWFMNASGLDEEGHYTTARDIATMSAELLEYPLVSKYSTIWMDSLRGGATQLVNTNRLVRFYQGATGLKTGTTDEAGVCVSASATRNGMSLIAVTLGSQTSDERFNTAQSLLNYGFATYTVIAPPDITAETAPVKVIGGVKRECVVDYKAPEKIVVKKTDEKNLTQTVELAENLTAPVEMGQVIGKVVISGSEGEITSYSLMAAEAIEKMTFGRAFDMLLKALLKMS